MPKLFHNINIIIKFEWLITSVCMREKKQMNSSIYLNNVYTLISWRTTIHDSSY